MTIANCPICDGVGGRHEDHCIGKREAELEVEKAWRTHHDPGSAEEAHSRKVRADKYLAMSQLLMEIAHCAPADNHVSHFGPRAKAILAGMQPVFREPDRLNRSIEVLKILSDLTVELTELKMAAVPHLAIENFAPELLGNLLACFDPPRLEQRP